ncbi:MAG: hypothetical protein Q9212_004225 [Teloschistes hypoglaucus]
MAGSLASSPPASPPAVRPLSAIFQSRRSSSRLSVVSKVDGGSRASDEDAKTLVKVAVRVRPPLNSTDPGFDLVPQRFQRSMVQVSSPTSIAIDSPQGRKLFLFDRVFDEDVSQEYVWEYLHGSVNAFIQGFNVSVLAYGQSGSGKSYTMGTSGPDEQSDSHIMGVVPRAAAALFSHLAGPPPFRRHGSSSLRTPTRYSTSSPPTLSSLAKSNTNEDWQLKATYVEIYNERLRDLLLPESTPQNERATVVIREDVKGRILLTGLHQVTINSIEDLLNALNFGSSIRQTDATAINAKSSRSHAVFSLNLVQRKNKASQMSPHEKRYSMPVEALSASENWVTVDSKLHFVDLAGSERLKNTQASGERAKEGISINAGLASLGKVISQLSSRQAGSHVSYRDSKLTRLLQDSLGGNAITYMIACVTPAEFYLSESLNTLQYAQQARQIQSKPQIQQISDDSDKQAMIERLRAEISFLHEQLRGPERDRRGNMAQGKGERQNEVEVELQNHLLDVQESYTALSQRHAKLISEITKARDTENSATPTLAQAIGDSAVERLKRSNSFAEAVEQVVLEYEKTIQSLESSLSQTRSSLANSESSLLERESKCASIEAVNQQLQSRLRKLADREASTEHYLHDLEAKLDGHSSGEEKNSAVINELRKEIVRIRENEASCEDYITTLEERLAESDQDMESMQREVDRLEHVVERQRSVGKLDNLLYEFDNLQQNGGPREELKPLTNGATGQRGKGPKRVDPALEEATQTAIPESDSEEDSMRDIPITNGDQQHGKADKTPKKKRPQFREVKFSDSRLTPHKDSPIHSPSQSQFVADKLGDVTQELFDLKVEHESTLSEFELMSAKYEEALRTLAELQDAVDEARHPATRNDMGTPASTRPSSFLGSARVNELKGGPLSSSRSLLTELSSAGDSTSTVASSPSEERLTRTLSENSERTTRNEPNSPPEAIPPARSEARSEGANAHGMEALRVQYNQLQEVHGETLDVVEELKAELHKAKMNSPTTSLEPVIRRKSSQNVMTIDRAHRSLASLKNIAADNLEDKPDTLQSFELNLNTAMHELHQRSERIQVLEAELASVKKDMEGKMAMISGLARERSSLKASSPMDISVVASLQQQLMQHENKMKMMQEDHDQRERDLMRELEFVQRAFEQNQHSTESAMPGVFPETPAVTEMNGKQLGHDGEELVRLQGEVGEWQEKHRTAVEAMEASEKKLLGTVSELEASMAKVESMHQRRMREIDSGTERDIAKALETDQERAQHAQTVQGLRDEVAEHKKTVQGHVVRIAELEQEHSTTQAQIEESARDKVLTDQQLSSHQNQIADLEEKVQEHQSNVEFHKHGLKSLHDSHARELEDLRSRLVAEARADMTKRNDELIQEHQYAFSKEADALNLRIQTLTTQLDEQEEKYVQMEKEREEVAASFDQARTELDKVSNEKETATRLVNELEDQLTQSYDQQRATSNRLSALGSNHDQALQEALAAKTKLEWDLENYRRRLDHVEVRESDAWCKGREANWEQSQMRSTSPHTDGAPGYERSNSLTSNLRKSTSVTSLPSPPPAIPLPPLPAQAGNGPAPVNAHEYVSVQYAEDQEARIRTIEKHLFAEKQLTATLEEALVDLENQNNRTKGDLEAWKKKCWTYEEELATLKKERSSIRHSVQAVEEERSARREAEAARAHLEERMTALQKKKKKSGFNCF